LNSRESAHRLAALTSRWHAGREELVKRSVITAAWRIAACVLAVSLVACGGGSSNDESGDPTRDKLAQILARGTLVEYFEPDYPPQSQNVEGATRPADTKCTETQLTAPEVTGYDNEVTKLIADELGVEACFVSPTWTEVTGGNWGDRWDIAYGSGSINVDRMARLYMTQPYYAVPNRYFVAKDSPYRTPSDLDGKKIGACAGCSHELYLKGELAIPSIDVVLDVRNPQIVTYETEEPGLVAAAKGEIDAFLAADPVGAARVEEGLALRPLDAISFTYYPSGFVDKSSGLSSAAFIQRINEIVQGFQADGTLKELSQRWFGTDYASEAANFDIDAIEQEAVE
jgi:polar amino acid transport system substrate-binding protein